MRNGLLTAIVAAAEREPETVGLLLHGSRAGGEPRPDSDYDLIQVVTHEENEIRRERSGLLGRSRDDGKPKACIAGTPSVRARAA